MSLKVSHSAGRRRRLFMWTGVSAIALLIVVGVRGQSVGGSPTDFLTPASMAPGSPTGSRALSDLESISNYSGNLSFRIPLVAVNGRGETSYSKTVVIENHWQMRSWRYWQGPGYPSYYEVQYRPESTHTNIPGMPKPGDVGVLYGRRGRDKTPGVYVPSNWNYTALTQLTFVGLDGSETSLRDVLTDGKPQLCEQAVDASGGFSRGTVFTDRISNSMTFVSNAPIRDLACGDTSFAVMNGLEILRPSGTLYLHSNGTQINIQNGAVISVTDRNGNTSLGNGAATDPFGRPIGYDTIKGFGGQSRTVQVIKRPLGEALRSGFTLQVYYQLFPGVNMLESDRNIIYNPQVIAEIVLPNGKSYKFKYSNYGMLSQVELPTGGRVEYDWSAPTWESYYGFIRNPQLIERREYQTATSTTWNARSTFTTYPTAEYCPDTIQCNTKAQVSRDYRDIDNTEKSLGSTTHYFHGVLHDYDSNWKPYPKPFDGREFRTEVFDETVTLKNISESIWNSSSYSTTYPSSASGGYQYITLPTHPYVQEVRNTIVEGNLISKKSFAYDPELRLTDTYEYDFGNVFVRRTHIDYVNDPAYIQKHLRNLPLSTWISSDVAGSNKVARTDTEYDNYSADSSHASLLTRNNVIGHNSADYGPGVTIRGNATSVRTYSNAQDLNSGVAVYSQYDVLGNSVKVIDARGNATLIDYSDRFGSPDGEARANAAPVELGGQNGFAYPTSSTNTIGWTTGYSQRDFHTGLPVDIEDLNGVVNSTFYDDPLNRPTQSIAASNQLTHKHQTTSVYDEVNRKITTTTDLFSYGDNLSKAEGFYDEWGRTFESRDFRDGGYVATKTVFDGLGRPRRATNEFVSKVVELRFCILVGAACYRRFSKPVIKMA